MTHVRIYKFDRYQRKYRLSHTKRFGTDREANRYIADRVSAYLAFNEVMGYCQWPPDALKVV